MDTLTTFNPKKIYDIIDKLDFFDSFTTIEKRKVASCNTHILAFKEKEYLIKENTSEKTLFLLLTGSVQVIKDNNPLYLAELKPGEYFGEIAFLTNEKRTSNVVANEQVLVLKIDNSILNDLSSDIREKIKDQIITKLVKYLKGMNDLLST